jgi:hypothetical protein
VQKPQRANCTEVFVQVFRTCTWVAVETVAYVRKFQQGQSCTSVQGFWAGTGPYRLTPAAVRLTSTSHAGGLWYICKLEILLIFCGFKRISFVLKFGKFVLAGRFGFALRISEFDNIIEQKICVSCVLMIHL